MFVISCIFIIQVTISIQYNRIFFYLAKYSELKIICNNFDVCSNFYSNIFSKIITQATYFLFLL